MSYSNIESLMQRGHWDDAIMECRAVLQVQPTNARIHAYLGMCHFRKKEWESAAASLRRATILDGNFLDAGIKLAQALEKLDRHLEAYDVCQEFLRLQPGNSTLRGLREFLESHLNERRVDGWERTTRLNTQMIENLGD
jgi:uncharacterized protein HemY